jgi:Zn-dependent protease
MFGFGPDMLYRIPALLMALTIHEYAHARVAVALGDPTPKVLGRVTLNPLSHLDPVGLIMLWLVQFGWAKPVPINPNNFADWKRGTRLVSLAGPVANILLSLVMAILFTGLIKIGVIDGNDWLSNVIRLTYVYNIIFAVFNMFPIPPLDGSKVVSSFLPNEMAWRYESIERYGIFIILALSWLGVIWGILSPIADGISFVIQLIVQLIF